MHNEYFRWADDNEGGSDPMEEHIFVVVEEHKMKISKLKKKLNFESRKEKFGIGLVALLWVLSCFRGMSCLMKCGLSKSRRWFQNLCLFWDCFKVSFGGCFNMLMYFLFLMILVFCWVGIV